MKHEAGKGEVVESSEGLGEPLVITSQAPESTSLGEAAFHHTAWRQQDETALGLSVLDHLQLNAMRVGVFSRRFTDIGLIPYASLALWPVTSHICQITPHSTSPYQALGHEQ